MLILCAYMLSFALIPEGPTGDITIHFENLTSANGHIRLALYDSKADFMDEKKAKLYNFKVTSKGNMKAEIKGLPLGEYAFAVFHDENDNMKLDKNIFGVPTEPYAFSKPAPSKWRLPTFEETKFQLNSSSQPLSVRLESWKL